MLSINRVTLIGFLGQAAEVKTTRNNGAPFTVFSLATDRCWRDRSSGQFKSEVTWHRCVAYGHVGEYAAKLAKGAHVQVEGEVRTRQYATAGENGSAAKKTITEIRVRQIARIVRPAKQLQEGGAA